MWRLSARCHISFFVFDAVPEHLLEGDSKWALICLIILEDRLTSPKLMDGTRKNIQKFKHTKRINMFFTSSHSINLSVQRSDSFFDDVKMTYGIVNSNQMM